MKLKTLTKLLSAQMICGNEEQDVEGGYCGDFLSIVMGKAKMGSAWFTVMNNINVAGVAVLSEVACVVLCDKTIPDPNLLQKAKMQNLNIICTELPTFEAVALAVKGGL